MYNSIISDDTELKRENEPAETTLVQIRQPSEDCRQIDFQRTYKILIVLQAVSVMIKNSKKCIYFHVFPNYIFRLQSHV